MSIKIIFGTDTGNTFRIVEDLEDLLNKDNITCDIKEVSSISPSDWNSHENYILGIPTWYDGELQSDWEDYFEVFKRIDFSGKKVAILGLGDQIGYYDWFCDGIGILGKVVLENGGELVGLTKNDETYDIPLSCVSLLNDDTFYGLCIDEDNQDNLTEERLENWVYQLKNEF